MSDDRELDDRLRAMAEASMARRSDAVDVDAAWNERPLPDARGRTPGRRSFAAAAAALLVVGGALVVAWPRDGGRNVVTTDDDIVVRIDEPAPPTSRSDPTPPTSTPASTAASPTTTAPPTTAMTDAGRPPPIDAGTPDSCTDDPLPPPSLADGTPAGESTIEDVDGRALARWGSAESPFSVTQTLGGIEDPSWIDRAVADGRALVAGEWQATVVYVGDPPISGFTVYVRQGDGGCLRSFSVGSGFQADQAQDLAELWVVSLDSGEPAPAPTHADLGLGYFGRRPTPLDATFFAIDEFDSTGTFVRTLASEEVAALYGEDLVDGSRVRFESARVEVRCAGRSIVRTDMSGDDTQVGVGRSFTVAPDGRLLVIRDVCPDDATWGDEGTFNELVAIDPLDPQAEVESISSWEPDLDAIVFVDGRSVISLDDRIVGEVRGDGRYVGVRQTIEEDLPRWSVLDLVDGASGVDLPTACPVAGDIVGPPQFVGNTLLVARICLSVDDALLVEAIGFGGDSPSLLWSESVPGPVPVTFDVRRIELDADRTPAGQLVAIASGDGGTETAGRKIALVDGDAVDISRLGYRSLTLDPRDLITEFDTPPT